MKRSHDEKKDDEKKDDKKKDKKESRRGVLAAYLKQEKDIAALRIKQAETTEKLRCIAKETVMENLGVIGPFRDRFIERLGMIVDFGVSLTNDDASILLERDDSDVGFFYVKHDIDLDEVHVYFIDNETMCTVHDIEHSALDLNFCHSYSIAKGKWELCQNDNRCECRGAGSELHHFQKFVGKHARSIVALMHEMVSLYHAFMDAPQKMLDKIENAIFVKKHKKDDGKK